MDAVAYKDMLKHLLPRGDAWEAPDGGPLSQLLLAYGDDMAAFDARMVALMEEADPRTALELIAVWEVSAGLPDPCTGALTDIDQRRAALWQKITGQGGQSLAYYIQIALTLGFDVDPEEFRPFVAGSDCNQPCNDDSWHFAFWLHASAGPVDDDLKGVLECVIGRVKPAHTITFFTYDY
jgi:uncharacterized protein YmfQ (DUF2313 family)